MTTEAIDTRDAGALAYAKPIVEQIIIASPATGALSNPAATTTKPTTGVLDVGKSPFARFFFGGSDTADKTMNYQVIAWYPFKTSARVTAWIPKVIAKGAATLGATAVPTLFTAANGLFADTLTDTISEGGTVVSSPTGDMVASLKVATAGAPLLQVETDITTAATADVWAEKCDN